MKSNEGTFFPMRIMRSFPVKKVIPVRPVEAAARRNPEIGLKRRFLVLKK
jgi:hypothetical protein